MKNTILLLLLLPLSLCANGQTVTTDSTVSIPLRWMRKATADLRRYDDAKEEISLLKPRIQSQQRIIDLLQKDTAAKADYIDFLAARLKSESTLSQSLEANCNSQLADSQKQFRKQRRRSTFQTIIISIAAGSTGYFIHSIAR